MSSGLPGGAGGAYSPEHGCENTTVDDVSCYSSELGYVSITAQVQRANYLLLGLSLK